MSSEERVEKLLKDTAPGGDNRDVLRTLEVSEDVVTTVIEDFNGWVDVKKIHVYEEDKVGITARFRWSIERFVASGMEDIIRDRGYYIAPHLEADWREREEDEVEYRVRKQMGEYDVFVNILVEMTERAFRMLNEGASQIEEQREKKERVSEFLEEVDE